MLNLTTTSNSRLLIAGFIFIFLAAASNSNLSAQEPVINESRAKDALATKNIRAEGWEIPGINNKHLAATKFITLQGYPVEEDIYDYPQVIETQLETYYIDDHHKLATSVRNADVNGLVSYSFNNKIFAHSVIYRPFSRSKDGRKIYPVYYTIIYFYDDNGDGLFNLRSTTSVMRESIPEWALK